MQTSSSDIFYWLAATHLKGIGPIRIRQYLSYFSDIKSLLTAKTKELQAIGIKEKYIHAIQSIHWKTVEQDLAWCNNHACHLISYTDPHYPILLQEIADSPLLLFVRGNIALLSQAQLAVVGSRNPTINGNKTAEQFAYQLSKAGLIITSGLALGIDAAAHRGALSDNGKTIAVLGMGIDSIYPSSHQKLADKIIEQGALISEFPPRTPPKAKHFPMRNRIISGLSLGVLIIEAALQSGSLITAHYAIEQGREVFAIPGSIHNPLARGCHKLIREGAKLVETTADIIEELGPLKASAMRPIGRNLTPKPLNLDTQHQHILQQIGYEITPLDAIIMRSGLTASEVSSILMTLELEGYATAVTGGYIRNL